MACAAFHYFGTWHDALMAAGLTPATPGPPSRTRWTRKVVLEEIRARWQDGAPMTVAANPKLAAAAIRRFSRWTAALRAAGVPQKPQRTWSTPIVLETIRALHRQGVLPERGGYCDSALVAAAAARFRSWHRALVAAGVRAPDEKPTRAFRWTAERVIEAIQNRYVQGLPLVRGHDRHLASAAVRRFGSWRAAVVAAGIPSVEKPKPHRTWTAQRVIEAIVAHAASGHDLVRVRRTDSGLEAAARKHFGSWRKALAAAGLLHTEDDR